MQPKKALKPVTTHAAITIVTPGLNEEKNLPNCLDAILNQTVKPTEVIFVNHNSTDNTLQVANSYKPKFKKADIKYTVLTEKKKGIANARNAGWNIATQPIIASLDSDCIPSKNWIENIDRFFKNSTALACTGKIVHYDVNELWKTVMDKANYYGFINQLMYIGNGFVPLATGNCAIRKKTFKKVGGFDPNIISINGLDDLEIASKIAHYGRVEYVADIVVFTSFRRYKNFEKAITSLLERNIAMIKIRNKFKKIDRIQNPTMLDSIISNLQELFEEKSEDLKPKK